MIEGNENQNDEKPMPTSSKDGIEISGENHNIVKNEEQNNEYEIKFNDNNNAQLPLPRIRPRPPWHGSSRNNWQCAKGDPSWDNFCWALDHTGKLT